MRAVMLRYAAIALLAGATSLQAAPPASVSATYEVRMNGLSVASITESYQSQGGSYRLTSNSTPHGIFALVKKLAVSFTSSGDVTAQGLRPQRFEGRRATGQIPEATADFDWSSGRLQLEHEGKAQTLPLTSGVQDRLSVMYEFMFVAPGAADTIEVAVTNGRSLDRYVYSVTRDVEQDTALGRIRTLHLVRQRAAGDPQNEIWLSPEHGYLPVRMTIVERNGTRYEQLVSQLDLRP